MPGVCVDDWKGWLMAESQNAPDPESGSGLGAERQSEAAQIRDRLIRKLGALIRRDGRAGAIIAVGASGPAASPKPEDRESESALIERPARRAQSGGEARPPKKAEYPAVWDADNVPSREAGESPENGSNRPFRLGLALSGGASKGFAHIGVLKVLKECGIKIDVVTGTSAGAIAGALRCSGYEPEDIEKLAYVLDPTDVVDLSLSLSGFVKGDRLETWMDWQTNRTPIEKMAPTFAAVATDFTTGRPFVFVQGPAGPAVRASSSVPTVFQPALIDGRNYVDGGLSIPVPVRLARALGASAVVAVDITQGPRANIGSNMVASFNQVINIMSSQLKMRELAFADVVISPDVEEIGVTGGFSDRKLTIETGEKAAMDSMPEIMDLIARGKPRIPAIGPFDPDTNAGMSLSRFCEMRRRADRG